MTARAATSRLLALGRRLLPPADWTYLLSLLVPALVLDLTLGWMRASSQFNPPGPIGALGQLQSDLLAHLGTMTAWVLLFALLRSGWRRAMLLSGFHLLVLAYLLFAVMAHGYYRKTGSVLDGGTLMAASESPDILAVLVASQTSATHAIMLLVVVGYGLCGPALVTRAWRGTWLPGLAGAEPVTDGPRLGRVALVAGLLSFGLVVGSATTTFTGGGAFSRNRAMDVALELTSSALQPEAASANQQLLPPVELLRTDTTKKRNVVMIYLESVRAEATSVYTKERSTTPFLARLAKQSIVAENAYAVVPHTSKSLTAAHCGIEPALDTEAIESDAGNIPTTCLPALLGREGYATAFFQSAVGRFEDRPGLMGNLGFAEYRPVETFPVAGFQRANYFGYEDDVMLEPARDWMRKQHGRPFLLSMLTVTGHHDYWLPTTFPQRMLAAGDPELNLYLNAVRYQDRFVERVFAVLDVLGLADDTIVVVSGDHGEAFSEHGLRQHDNAIYNEGIKIPLLVHDPQRRPRRVETPVSNMTIPATVSELLGYRLTGGRQRAGSLLRPSTDPIRSSCFADNRCLARIEGNIKYVHHFRNRPEEVFDLAADPHEQTNLIGELPAGELRRLRADLLRWRQEVRAVYPGRRVPR